MLAGTTGLLYAAPLRSGDDGTEQTISMLRNLVDDAWKDPEVNRAAIEIVRQSGVPQYDSWGQIRAIYDFAHSFYFVNDPLNKETLRPTRALLELRAGDCDDINANVLPALLGSIGFETRLVTIAADSRYPDLFSHVYAEVFQDGAWYPLDAARPDAQFGVAPARYYRREWWSLEDGSHGDYTDDGTMAGYMPRALRGLGAVVASSPASVASALLTDTSQILQSVGGQTVQAAIQPAQGPGGATMVAPGAATLTASSGTELLILLGVGIALWALFKD
jgi:transglutaminase superfamily protein